MVDQPPFRREAVAAPVYISWGAVIAGAIAASALTFVLITFGGGDRPCHRFALGHLARYVSGACLVVGALASAHRSRELCARRLSRRPAAGDLGHHGCRRGRIP